MAKRLSVLNAQRCVGCQCCMFACSLRVGQAGLAASCIGIKSAGGISKGFYVVVCRSCPNPPCARVCPTDALYERPDGGGVRFKSELCIGCKNCVEACPFGAVFWSAEDDKPQICVYCGYCAPYCVYDVLALEEIKATEEIKMTEEIKVTGEVPATGDVTEASHAT